MVKKRENTLSLWHIFVLLVFIASLSIAAFYTNKYIGFSFTGFAIFFTGSQSNFSDGAYNNTEWSTDHVQLSQGNLSGTGRGEGGRVLGRFAAGDARQCAADRRHVGGRAERSLAQHWPRHAGLDAGLRLSAAAG